MPAKPGAARKDLIPIGRGAPGIGRSNGSSDPYKFWEDYYRKHDESAEKLRETLRLLNLSRKFREVHAALRAYLTLRRNYAEPWMYEAFAMAIEMNGGKPEDVKQALNYAADLAQKTHNPNHLVSVADKLYLKGYYERVGALLDEAAGKVPHRYEPLVMSINLAQKTKDPKRMADAFERLLSLGWPGNDDYIRRESRNQAEQLAKHLREEGRGEEADALLAKLPDAEARDLFIRLSWDGNADYDLIVQEPLGAFAQFDTPRTVFGGALIKNGYGNRPEEVYVCPRGFDGDYTVRISMIYTDPKKPTTQIKLETITHEGTPQEHKEVHTFRPDDPLAKPVVVHLSAGRRKSVLPFISPSAIIEGGVKATTGPGRRTSRPDRAVRRDSSSPSSSPDRASERPKR